MVSVQQAEIVYNYKKTKGKLFEIKTGIWFNKICRINHVTHRSIHINTNLNVCMVLPV